MTTSNKPSIIITETDEAPGLASKNFLRVVKYILNSGGIDVQTKDISFAHRVLATFDDNVVDHMKDVGDLVKRPEATIIKLPNISATYNQLIDCIAELQDKSYSIPDYPTDPKTEAERAIKSKYDSLTGSVVNSVFRGGNTDRSIPDSVKAHARANPHKVGDWPEDSKTHVASMDKSDFLSTEQSSVVTEAQAGKARIEFVAEDGTVTILEDEQDKRENKKIIVSEGDIIDAASLNRAELRALAAPAGQAALTGVNEAAGALSGSAEWVAGKLSQTTAPLEQVVNSTATVGAEQSLGYGT